MKRVYFLFISLLSIGIVIPYCVFAADVVKIGTINPMTGALALAGQETLRGIEIAAAMQNKRGGVQGKQIVLVKGDSQTLKTAVTEAERLINVEGVKLFCGEYSSSRAKAATAVTEKYGCPYLVDVALADDITSRGFKYVFQAMGRAYLWGSDGANFIAEEAAPKLGKKPNELRVALAHEDSDFGTSISAAFVQKAMEYHMKIVATEPYSANAVDLSSLVLRLKQANPDILILTPYIRDGILFLSQARDAGLSPKVILCPGGVLSNQVFNDKLGDDMNYMLCSSSGSLDVKREAFKPEGWAALQEFIEQYKKEYKQDPPQDAYHGFNGAWLFFHFVLPRSKSMDPDDVEKTLRNFTLEPGESVTTSGYKFAPLGHSNPGTNLIGYPNIFQWQKGSIKHFVYPKKFASSELMLPMPPWGQRSMK